MNDFTTLTDDELHAEFGKNAFDLEVMEAKVNAFIQSLGVEAAQKKQVALREEMLRRLKAADSAESCERA